MKFEGREDMLKVSSNSIEYSRLMAGRFSHEISRLGITQRELASKTGLSTVTISNYAKGHRPPSSEVLVKLDEMGADIRFILTGKFGCHPGNASIDIQRFGLAFEEAQRQSDSNRENLSQKALIERAWVIYQAWSAVPASSSEATSMGADRPTISGS